MPTYIVTVNHSEVIEAATESEALEAFHDKIYSMYQSGSELDTTVVNDDLRAMQKMYRATKQSIVCNDARNAGLQASRVAHYAFNADPALRD